nr:polyprenyl synthetase family protein [Leucobacter weissii]
MRREIEDELSSFFAARTSAAQVYGPEFARLWELAAESVLGGKMLRPCLLVTVFEAFLEDRASSSPECDREGLVRLASAIELLHFAFLLHDDVIDGDLMRRHRPNLIGSILEESAASPRSRRTSVEAEQDVRLHWARTGGLLMGDLVLSAVHQTIARERLSHDARLSLLDLLDHSIVDSVAGEHLDVGMSDGAIRIDLRRILTMSQLKTATYSFELPLRAAALLSGQSREAQEQLAEAGRHLGLAFQLQDDLLSVFGQHEDHGKDPFSDLREGKETAIIAYARMTSSWARIEPVFGASDLSEGDGLTARAALSECGAERFVRFLIADEIDACLQLISRPESALPERVGDVLRSLVSSLEHRRA